MNRIFYFQIILEVVNSLLQSLTMTSKQKIILTNSNTNKYQFSYFLKQYQQILINLHSPELLQPHDIFKLLDTMGFLPQLKTEKDYQLVNTIAYLLAYPKGQATVSPRNLFRFLIAVNHLHGPLQSHFESQVQPLPKDCPFLQIPLIPVTIGSFDTQGKWNLTRKEEEQICQIFGHMLYTRVSRYSQEHKNTNQQKQTFQPKILQKSSVLAEYRFKRLGSQGRVEDRLLQSKSITENKIQIQKKENIQNELKSCTFKPKINYFKFSVEQEKKREQILLQKGKEYQIKRKIRTLSKNENDTKINQSWCSFNPDLSLSRASLRTSIRRQNTSTVKNQEKSVDRMRFACQQRQHLNQVNKRGYPQGVSWLSYMQEVRNKRAGRHTLSVCDQLNSMSIDLKNISGSLNLQMKEGQNVQALASTFCKQYKIPSEKKGPLLNLIKKSINNSNQAIVRNGKVYLT